MDTPSQPSTGFDSLGLAPAILSVLARHNFTQPTPIQAAAIPVAIKGQDIIGIAQTGTGKTFAFGLPIVHRLMNMPGRALIVVPTRELALQVEENIRSIVRPLNTQLRTVCLIGGMPIYRQIRDLQHNPRIIVVTPGRLNDHLKQGTIKLGDVNTVVLDEADRMLDMGFAPQIKLIFEQVPADRQTMLFSATMAPEIAAMTKTYLQNPERIEVARVGQTAELIQQEICYVHQSEKPAMLQLLLTEHLGTVLVFSRTKHGATKLAHILRESGHTATEIHSNRSLAQRRQALDGFKNGRYRVLVATDVAARGIDVQNITLVINYDLPDASEDYVHRIGRTGRAGANGLAISLATPDQRRDVAMIERLIGRTLPLSAHSAAVSQSQSGSYQGGQRRQDSRPPYQGGFRGNNRPQQFGDRERRPNQDRRPQTGGPAKNNRFGRRPERKEANFGPIADSSQNRWMQPRGRKFQD